MKALLAHPGTQHSFRLAAELSRQELLLQFWTGIAYRRESLTGKAIRLLPKKIKNHLTNRGIKGIFPEQLKLQLLQEWKAIRALQRGAEPISTFYSRNEIFQKCIPYDSIRRSSVIIGFDTSSWILARRAKDMGKTFFLDQTIAHPLTKKRAFVEVRKQFPNWAEELEGHPTYLLDAEQLEYNLADQIVVASSFTKETLIENGVEAAKIIINPYGVDLAAFRPIKRPVTSRSLRFLFVGSVTARKGIPLLTAAWKKLEKKDSELWISGYVSPESARLITPAKGLRLLGKVSHESLPSIMDQCDVLVLPSYFEGFGLVLLEALASGMPIISTPATAAPDLLNGKNAGFVIPAGDEEALIERLQYFINGPEVLETMGRIAREQAEFYSWESYGLRWAELLGKL